MCLACRSLPSPQIKVAQLRGARGLYHDFAGMDGTLAEDVSVPLFSGSSCALQIANEKH